MLILKLAYSGDLDFIHELQELKELLKKKKIVIGLVESMEGDTHLIKIICDKDSYSEKLENTINIYISNILYRIVIKHYKEKELYEFLVDSYFFLKRDEILEVERDIMNVLSGEEGIKDEDSVFCANRMNSIVNKIKECIEEKKEININGFITFRMRELREDIEVIIEKVVEKYMVEKEYREFIKLLKYFVEIQDCKIEKVNIIKNESGEYKILDGNGENILEKFIEELADCKLGVDANLEDVIISGLITSAPEEIVIHNEKFFTNKEFLETIKNVFCERVRFCHGCIYCENSNVKYINK